MHECLFLIKFRIFFKLHIITINIALFLEKIVYLITKLNSIIDLFFFNTISLYFILSSLQNLMNLKLPYLFREDIDNIYY